MEPFGLKKFNVTLQAIGGGLCFGTGYPQPSSMLFVGGFRWGGNATAPPILSGVVFIDVELSGSAGRQFVYAQLQCSLQPCSLSNVLKEMGVSGIDTVSKFLPETEIRCNDPVCKVWVNTNGIWPASPVVLTDPTSPNSSKITVPGGFGLDLPYFKWMCLEGGANMSLAYVATFCTHAVQYTLNTSSTYSTLARGGLHALHVPSHSRTPPSCCTG